VRLSLIVLLIGAVVVLSGTACASSTQQAPKEVRELGVIKDRMDALDRRVNGVRPAQPLTQQSLVRYAEDLQPLVDEYGVLLADAETTHTSVAPIDDPDVRAAWRLLIVRIRNSRDGLGATTSDLRQLRFKDFATEVKARKAETDRLDARWQDIANRINDRYAR
jgi:hypothetical protein